MHLKWPFALLLLLIPLGILIYRRFRPSKPKITPIAETSVVHKLPSYKKRENRIQRLRLAETVLLLLVTINVVVLVARPQTAISKVDEETSHDVVIAADLSGSMKDYIPDALKAMKEIVTKNPGDRYAIVLFRGRAFTSLALTRDTVAINQKVDYLSDPNDGVTNIYKSAGGSTWGGEGGTDIGKALLASLQRFDQLDKPRSRSIIMISDLVSNSAEDYLDIAPLVPKYKVNLYAVVPTGAGEFGGNIFTTAQKSQFTSLTGAKLSPLGSKEEMSKTLEDISQQILNKDKTSAFVLADNPYPWLISLLLLVGAWTAVVLLRWSKR